MEKMGFERYGFQTIFGFTYSIFIRHGTACSTAAASNTTTTDSSKQHIVQFLEDCQNQLNIKIEHKNRFQFTIIFDKKNRYIAWTGNPEDRPILKNLDGMSRKYPTWIKQQIENIATHLITKSNDVDVTPVIKQAFEDLSPVDQVDRNERLGASDKETITTLLKECGQTQTEVLSRHLLFLPRNSLNEVVPLTFIKQNSVLISYKTDR